MTDSNMKAFNKIYRMIHNITNIPLHKTSRLGDTAFCFIFSSIYNPHTYSTFVYIPTNNAERTVYFARWVSKNLMIYNHTKNTQIIVDMFHSGKWDLHMVARIYTHETQTPIPYIASIHPTNLMQSIGTISMNEVSGMYLYNHNHFQINQLQKINGFIRSLPRRLHRRRQKVINDTIKYSPPSSLIQSFKGGYKYHFLKKSFHDASSSSSSIPIDD